MNEKCKICRRAGTKLFLKADRCLSVKCAMVKRPYAPGPKPKKRKKTVSEYGKELEEKQKMKKWYHLRERQFRNYVKAILEKRGKVEDASVLLLRSLEHRLDNVVFRIGFASSRIQARQFISHGHFLVNGKKIDVPSYRVKKNDKISLRPQSAMKPVFKNLSAILKKVKAPAWLEINASNLEGVVKGEPTLEEAAPPAEISSIFEYYSR